MRINDLIRRAAFAAVLMAPLYGCSGCGPAAYPTLDRTPSSGAGGSPSPAPMATPPEAAGRGFGWRIIRIQ